MKEAPIFFSQEGKNYMDFVTPTGDTKIVEVPLAPHDMRHADNLSHLTGFYKGEYYREGTPAKNFPNRGTIYERT